MRKQFAFFGLLFLAMILSGCAGGSVSSLLNQQTAPQPEHIAPVVTAPAAPHKIALLLPLKGNIAATSQAIKNGFLAAYYQEREQNSNLDIKIIDTSGGNISALYQQAVAGGADMVVGPLTKAEVEQMSGMSSLTVPVIALNTLDNYRRHTVNNLYQFGLTPQDEAEQTANRMHNASLKNVAIIAPSGSWGEKIVAAFRDKFESEGGKVVTTMSFSAHDDFTAEVCQLVTADPENMCRRHLNKAQKQKITIARRPDIDSFFLVLTPQQARQIVPLLKFYYAGGLPAFAISSIYSGNPQPSLDQDINGVYFCDMPWVFPDGVALSADQLAIKRELQNTWKDSFAAYSKLYALGVDSFLLATKLHNMLAQPQGELAGVTGKLYIDKNNHVYRQLTWGRFQQGWPVVLN